MLPVRFVRLDGAPSKSSMYRVVSPPTRVRSAENGGGEVSRSCVDGGVGVATRVGVGAGVGVAVGVVVAVGVGVLVRAGEKVGVGAGVSVGVELVQLIPTKAAKTSTKGIRIRVKGLTLHL